MLGNMKDVAFIRLQSHKLPRDKVVINLSVYSMGMLIPGMLTMVLDKGKGVTIFDQHSQSGLEIINIS